MTRRVLLTAGALAAALAGTPAAADAARVSLVPELHAQYEYSSAVALRLTVSAGPGERNDITAVDRGGELVVADAGAALSAGRGCAAAGDGTVHCAKPDVTSTDPLDVTELAGTTLHVTLGDRDDRFSTAIADLGARDSRIVGGTGDDVIRARHATLYGGRGDDTLIGGPGGGAEPATVLHGGAGADLLRGLTRGSDCGSGRDRFTRVAALPRRQVPRDCERALAAVNGRR